MKVESVISLKNVWRSYQMGDSVLHAAKQINLEIPKGEFIAIVGPSGAGKSTIMNLIGCLDIPTKGKIFLDNKDISKLKESDLSNIRGKKIGFVFQQFNLLPSLSALENVYLPMSFQNTDRTKGIKKAEQLLKKVGMSHRLHHKPSELSGGERQRVSIARSLANSPEIVLADEPTGNLDTKTGKNVMDLLNEIHQTGSTVILITHDLHLVKHAERIIFLKDGIIEKMKKNGKRGK
ncbi:ABC transporter ATP-binding protein [Candidatus Woesearchaeota archaeon]|jgi:putative ABC transport system ATP-binding protein|nr:ABC transporter ATP-binding protein [Candidatus Woesearchaeota archaeon]MBT4783062.1 ABC transporter ATP-binding protein [Candidatus Woesearchaeota archaeon]MBT5112171.1 ABC transporter ATP-binding protein [Candidatus Woesearchaeota archaeon]MBT7555929.1 ABC transporter ATP-binding protein [Candidatus Woesearchaeota archaeon]